MARADARSVPHAPCGCPSLLVWSGRVDTNTWFPAVAGLVGAIIGAVAAVTSQVLQARRARKDQAEREYKLAVEDVLVRSQTMDMRTREMVLLASDVGSLAGLVARVFGSVAPVDHIAMFDRLHDEATALQRAAAQLWLFGDKRVVELSNAVVLAAAEVVSAHPSSRLSRTSNYLRIALTGRFAHDLERVQDARVALAEARQDLVQYAREELGLEAIDPFATTAG